MIVQTQSAGNVTNPEVLQAIVKASETYNIVASQDIVDARGLKLWAKGLPVSATLQQRLLDRKLQRPLEACLAVEDGVTLFSLHADLQAYLESDSALAQAMSPWAKLLLQQTKQLPLHSVAQLLLTTALATRPDTLRHAVAGMALAGTMAATGRSSSVDTKLAMLGGLLHDVGEVYIEPQYLDRHGPMDLAGHKHLVVHPRVAQMMLSDITDYPESLCRAIGEHHERFDGSGYPARLIGTNCSELGRLLAIVEVTLGISRSNSSPLTRTGFALRAVPGEFDLKWASIVCNMARSAHEPVPDDLRTPADLSDSPLVQINQRIEQGRQLLTTLKAQGRGGKILDIVEVALLRLYRLQVAWNALGFWGVEPKELSRTEKFELEMANKELKQRLTQLQRECLLLAERLGQIEKVSVEPLWIGILEKC